MSASAFAMCIALGGVFSAHGAIQRGSYHTPDDSGFSAFAIDPRNPQIVYAGSGGGVYKSTDAGRRWQAVNSGLIDPFVADLAIDKRNPRVLYAGIAAYDVGTSSGVFKSMNAGRTWRRMSSTGNDNDVVALALHPRNSRVVYAGTDEGVYKSSNAGASWRKVTTHHPHAVRVFTIAVDPQRPATVYAGSGGGVFKSTDAGRSWQKRNVGLLPNETANGNQLAEGFVIAIVVDPRRPQTLYAGSRQGIFKSTDGARTWRGVNAGLDSLNGPFRYAQSLAIDPSDTQTLYAGTAAPGLMKTTDGGRRWNATGLPVEGPMLALALEPTNPKTVYVGMPSGGKAFRSKDGGRTWSALSIIR